ncbi:TetR/AcrR family transcriptional regulator [Phenylobacterium sp.]|uniref:TetR/AcrR family transcriptional regulator n=1 Tax=Phenylobacterium sp. TaxID=1871053 RepID=UPI002FC5C28E
MTDAMTPARPTAEARRQQILDAASACARRAGFHGASMAEIAQAAGLSVGQIYRYFENKEAIIAAIVDQDVAEMREKFAEMEKAGGSLADAIIDRRFEALDRHYDPDYAALMLEVLAEAARNPRVAAIVREADTVERALKRSILDRVSPPGASEEELVARGEVLSMLFEGMVIRGVNNPSANRQAMGEVLGSVLRHLLTDCALPPAKPDNS